jgi:hypothetical protein
MKEQIVDYQISKTYKEQSFELDIDNEATLGRLFQSLIMIYSDKFSFIREFTQNAYDAVVEMWENKYINTIDLNTYLINNPIVVSLYEDSTGSYIEIKETEGVGMSEDRIDNMFRFVTKSSKRESIFQIGAKGIGKLAALAYTDCYYITTNYEGKCYEYKISWYLQAGVPKITEPVITNTSEKNGTTVKIYLTNRDHTKLLSRSILNFLSYFNNIYYNNLYVDARYSASCLYYYTSDNQRDYWGYDNNKSSASLNNLLLHNFNTFQYREKTEIFDRELFLLVDRIPYKIDWEMIGQNKIYFPFGLKVSSQYILLNDNRDSIRYTDTVIEHIKEKLIDFNKELLSFIVDGKCNKIDNFKEIILGRCKYCFPDNDKYEFTFTKNPLAIWSKSFNLIEKLVYNVDNNKLKDLFKIIAYKRKDKFYKKINLSTNFIHNFNEYFTAKAINFDVFINDIPKNHITASMIDSELCYIIDQPDIDNLDLTYFGIYDLNNQNFVKDEIRKYFDTIPKLSDNVNIVAKKKLNKSKNEIKITNITYRYYNNYDKHSEMIDISSISSDYIIFPDTSLKDAYRMCMFIRDFKMNKNVAVVAPTYYTKIKYNLNYFLYNSEYIKTINTCYIIHNIYPHLKKTIDLYKSRYIFNYIEYFKNTIIDTLLNEIISYENLEELLKNGYIKDKIDPLINNNLFVDKNYINNDIYQKLEKLHYIFNINYPELSVIDYNTDNNKTLINKLVKIILNKDNINEECL